MRKYYIYLCLIALGIVSCPMPPNGEGSSLIDSVIYIDTNEKSTDWTVMYYVDGDNDLESYLLDDIYELSQGMESTEIVNVIALVDRISGYSSDSSILGSNFTDTRLFRIGADDIIPLEGGDYFSDIGKAKSGEYNMGDGETLKTFIEYCKANYPADNYALIFSNHGGGVKGVSDDSGYIEAGGGLVSSSITTLPDKSVCYDYSSNEDCLYTAELTDVLDSSHSVDLMVYDACLLGLVEIAYQYRPGVSGEFSADYMVASVPSVWGYGLPYDLIFERVSATSADTGDDSTVTGGTEDMYTYTPQSLTPEIFGKIIVEEQKISTQSSSSQALALYNLNYVETVVDELNSVASGLQGTLVDDGDYDMGGDPITPTYQSDCISYASSYPVSYPHYDLYDFAVTTGSTDLQAYINSMVVASFGGSNYEDADINSNNYIEGKEGLGFFFPDGDIEYTDGVNTYPCWQWQWWYTGEDGSDVSVSMGDYYGKLDFCNSDDDDTGDGNVDGWFELLQYIYNYSNDESFHPGAY